VRGGTGTKTGEAQVLKNELERSQAILTTAKNLLSKLEDERVRWDGEYRNIEKETREYPVHSLIAAAFVGYLSDQDENER
jgi:dynein heavy chain 2, cytosolic